MGQFSLFSSEHEPALTVVDLTRRIRERLDGDPDLQDVWVTGEISNASQPRSGHFYFTLKDVEASLRCVMWKSQVMRLRFKPRDGEMVLVHGKISVYEAGGQYQLYADQIQAAGQGLLYQEFLRLKARLEGEGLFDPDRKRPLPVWPRRIGIITSPTGAALQDMLNTIRRRFPIAEVILAPSPVQGLDAPSGIIRGLKTLESARPDVILLARGGGSMEDLWAFNDEGVVRAVAASAIPIITGVGHETDFTLADFAADVRAPTPTAAAELATPDRVELLQGIRDTAQNLGRTLAGIIADRRWQLSEAHNRFLRFSPETRVRNDLQKVDGQTVRLSRAIEHWLGLQTLRLKALGGRLQASNPLAILERGFSIVTRPDGTVIRSVARVTPGDPFEVRIADGAFHAEVVRDESG